jgi:arabinofuranan 3-O-arabinosyltransferase
VPTYLELLRRRSRTVLGHRWTVRALWAVVAVCGGLRLVQGSRNAFDHAVVHDAALALLQGSDPYADPLFLYLPSAALLELPVVLLPRPAVAVVATAACLGAVGCAVFWSAKFFAPVRPRWVVPAVLLVVLVSPAGGALTVGANTEFLALAALPLLLRWAVQHRWTRFALLLGLTLAVKPILPALLVLPLLSRRWSTIVTTSAIPVVLSAAALPLMPGSWSLGRVILHRLAEGSPRPVSPWMEVSLAGALRNTSATSAWIIGVQALVLFVGMIACWLRWRADRPARVVETASIAVLTSIVAAPLAWDHYAVLLAPLVLALLGPAESARYRATVLLLLVPLAPLVVPQLEPARHPFGYGFRAAAGLLLCLLAAATVVVVRSVRNRPQAADRTAPQFGQWAPEGGAG